MPEAEETRAEVNRLIDICEDLQIQLLVLKTRIQELQGGVVLLDLTQSISPSVRSIARMAPLIGRSITDDQEIIGQVKSDLQDFASRL